MSRRGTTLVELLVAMALATILVGVVGLIWTQSQVIVTTSLRRLEIQQRLRVVLDRVARDLAFARATSNMEFHEDRQLFSRPPNGIWDAGEPLLTLEDQPFRAPHDPLDPLLATQPPSPEFCEDGSPVGFSSVSRTPFFAAPFLLSPTPTPPTSDQPAAWRDEIYFLTSTERGGGPEEALVHYRLVQTQPGRSLLRRRIWFRARSSVSASPAPASTGGVEDQTAVLADDVVEFKLGFFLKRSPYEPGEWWHVGGPARSDALERDAARGFRAARGPSSTALSSQHDEDASKPAAVAFLYQGYARIELESSGLAALRSLNAADAREGDLSSYTNFDFPGVRPGDVISLTMLQDDDPQVGPTDSAQALPSRRMTVAKVVAQPNPAGSSEPRAFSIRLRDPLHRGTLAGWLGAEAWDSPRTISEADVVANPRAGPPRKLRASYNVSYRLGFLPDAFYVRLAMAKPGIQRRVSRERVVRILTH